ncbi:uncharacterized protein BcabD6B2_16640 [Babesia caballi]|uniref:Integral membrane protein n=1 Tax=Babesia caballi TaxID=5871 RepID=A0AAV4LQJ3_BABCB|nr:integral membrane protein [Babesia caballi]
MPVHSGRPDQEDQHDGAGARRTAPMADRLVGLMHYMYSSQSWCLYLAILDVVCLCNWTFYSVPKMIGIKGANCWIIYSRLMTVKVLVLYYIVFPEFISKEGLIMGVACGASTEILLLLLLTPTLYVMMSFRAGAHLYGGLNCISSERLMHTDMIIHVAFDLLDLIDMCHVYLTIPIAFSHKNYIMEAFCGVVVATGIFLHSYSFPRMSETSKPRNTAGFNGDCFYSASDIYYSRKYAAIVGIFFVDIPFGIFRFSAWLMLAKHLVFGPFLLKNLCFIMIQAARIRHCSIGISHSSLGANALDYSKTSGDSHGKLPSTDGNSTTESDKPPHASGNAYGEDHTSPTEDDGDEHLIRKASVRFTTASDPFPDSDGIPDRLSISLSRGTTTRDGITRITIPEGFSVTVVSFKRLLQKILLSISVGSKCELAHLLDSTLKLSLWQNAMIALPHIVVWVVEVTIVIMFYRLDHKQLTADFSLFDFEGLARVSFAQLPFALQVVPFLILAASLVNLICWCLVCPFLGAIYVSLQVLVTLVSFSYVLLSLSEFIPALHILAFISEHTMGTPRDYLFFLFGVRPFLNLLGGLYPFLCLTLGKNYLFYINPSLVSAKNSDLLSSSVKLINGTFSVETDTLGQGESCAISLASLLVLTNAVIMCVPPSGHSLLVGPNLIKATSILIEQYTQPEATIIRPQARSSPGQQPQERLRAHLHHPPLLRAHGRRQKPPRVLLREHVLRRPHAAHRTLRPVLAGRAPRQHRRREQAGRLCRHPQGNPDAARPLPQDARIRAGALQHHPDRPRPLDLPEAAAERSVPLAPPVLGLPRRPALVHEHDDPALVGPRQQPRLLHQPRVRLDHVELPDRRRERDGPRVRHVHQAGHPRGDSLPPAALLAPLGGAQALRQLAAELHGRHRLAPPQPLDRLVALVQSHQVDAAPRSQRTARADSPVWQAVVVHPVDNRPLGPLNGHLGAVNLRHPHLHSSPTPAPPRPAAPRAAPPPPRSLRSEFILVARVEREVAHELVRRGGLLAAAVEEDVYLPRLGDLDAELEQVLLVERAALRLLPPPAVGLRGGRRRVRRPAHLPVVVVLVVVPVHDAPRQADSPPADHLQLLLLVLLEPPVRVHQHVALLVRRVARARVAVHALEVVEDEVVAAVRVGALQLLEERRAEGVLEEPLHQPVQRPALDGAQDAQADALQHRAPVPPRAHLRLQNPKDRPQHLVLGDVPLHAHVLHLDADVEELHGAHRHELVEGPQGARQHPQRQLVALHSQLEPVPVLPGAEREQLHGVHLGRAGGGRVLHVVPKHQVDQPVQHAVVVEERAHLVLLRQVHVFGVQQPEEDVARLRLHPLVGVCGDDVAQREEQRRLVLRLRVRVHGRPHDGGEHLQAQVEYLHRQRHGLHEPVAPGPQQVGPVVLRPRQRVLERRVVPLARLVLGSQILLKVSAGLRRPVQVPRQLVQQLAVLDLEQQRYPVRLVNSLRAPRRAQKLPQHQRRHVLFRQLVLERVDEPVPVARDDVQDLVRVREEHAVQPLYRELVQLPRQHHVLQVLDAVARVHQPVEGRVPQHDDVVVLHVLSEELDVLQAQVLREQLRVVLERLQQVEEELVADEDVHELQVPAPVQYQPRHHCCDRGERGEVLHLHAVPHHCERFAQPPPIQQVHEYHVGDGVLRQHGVQRRLQLPHLRHRRHRQRPVPASVLAPTHRRARVGRQRPVNRGRLDISVLLRLRPASSVAVSRRRLYAVLVDQPAYVGPALCATLTPDPTRRTCGRLRSGTRAPCTADPPLLLAR